ncbi:hypothetical protein ACM66B_001624 [Microbotryomycetes sp. NB124-2]
MSHVVNMDASTSSLTLDSAPRIVARAWAPPQPAHLKSNPFFRTLRVCPDGSCALVLAEDRSLSLFRMHDTPPSPNRDPEPRENQIEWQPEWTFRPPDSILSFEWFPGASSTNLVYFAFVVAIKDHPVQLLDGSDCRVRASYPIEDHQERFVAPHAMTFSDDGSLLYCGFENAIEVFQVGQPGAAGQRIHTSPSRASRQGQKGIISSLAFRPDNSGLLAAGSLSGTVGLYDTTRDNTLIKLIKVPRGKGVTMVHFHPKAHLLFVASRQSEGITVIDLRNFLKPLIQLKRRAPRTNQKFDFDVDPSGIWLVTGDKSGQLNCFSAEYDPANSSPLQQFRLSREPLGAATFVPGSSLLVTCSGTRHFQRDDNEFESSEEESASESDASGAEAARRTEVDANEGSLQLWELS